MSESVIAERKAAAEVRNDDGTDPASTLRERARLPRGNSRAPNNPPSNTCTRRNECLSSSHKRGRWSCIVLNLYRPPHHDELTAEPLHDPIQCGSSPTSRASRRSPPRRCCTTRSGAARRRRRRARAHHQATANARGRARGRERRTGRHPCRPHLGSPSSRSPAGLDESAGGTRHGADAL